jgi:hypothetical protein
VSDLQVLIVTKKVFYVFTIGALIVLGLLLLKVLTRHYWLMFFIWLMLPSLHILLTSDSIGSNISSEIQKAIKTLLLAVAMTLSIINLANYDTIRHSVGYQLVDNYRLVKSYNCEAEENGYGIPVGSPPEVCSVEDLSRVSWYSKVLLYISEWGFIFLVIAIPSFILITRQDTRGSGSK